MSELIFVVEEAPEGGFLARALGESIFTEADTLAELSGNPLETSFRDIWPTNPPPSFYRVRAELP